MNNLVTIDFEGKEAFDIRLEHILEEDTRITFEFTVQSYEYQVQISIDFPIKITLFNVEKLTDQTILEFGFSITTQSWSDLNIPSLAKLILGTTKWNIHPNVIERALFILLGNTSLTTVETIRTEIKCLDTTYTHPHK